MWLRYYYCGGQNNLANTKWKSGVVTLKTDEMIDSKEVRRPGVQVSDNESKTNRKGKQKKQLGI